MKTFTVSATTREYLSEQVTLTSPGVVLTDCPVSMALVPAGASPVNGDWKPVAWYTDPAGKTWVRALLGVDLLLTGGIFDACLRLDLGEEQPIRRFARLYVS